MMITPFLIGGTIVCSTCLILINKQVLSVNHFECPTFLTSYHFILTFLLLEIMGRLRFFEFPISFPALDAWKMAFFGTVSIVFMNFNLKTNSIGFYQLSKLCTIPCLVIYKFVGLQQSTPPKTLFSLAILLVGLCLFTVNDVQFNLFGSLIAAVAVVTTATYQTLTGTMQSQHHVSGTQLSHAVGLPQFVICFLAGILIETHGEQNIFQQMYNTKLVLLILSTGLFAVVGNVIAFSLIGKAGPVTFQVVGHVKTMLIFVFGLLMFPETYETSSQFLKKILGLTVAMVGVVLYTVFEMQIKAAEQREPEIKLALRSQSADR
jgi:solute carrier family 35 protein E3